MEERLEDANVAGPLASPSQLAGHGELGGVVQSSCCSPA